MSQYLSYALIATSVLLCVIVVIQSKGTGLSLAPGNGDFGKFEKRGAEKTLHVATIVIAALYVALAVAHFFLS
ncbi:MAG: Protein-export rane protein SecG [Patescibacteria group bacterium]|nr:Protein-export rane protein SecG [Patescibacteria group bacterium]